MRENLPAGSAAVLLNRVHKHSDLFLPITGAEDRLLAQVDGTRTLAEIAQTVSRVDVVAHLPQFFHTLWRYDQIVLDASHDHTAN